MQDHPLPLPELHGTHDPRGSLNHRRWMWVSLVSFAVWGALTGWLLYIANQQMPGEPPGWLMLTLVVTFLILSLSAFPPFLAGLFNFRTRHGKVTACVSGIHALLVIVIFAVVVAQIQQRGK